MLKEYLDRNRVLVCGVGRIVLASIKEAVGSYVHDAHHEG